MKEDRCVLLPFTQVKSEYIVTPRTWAHIVRVLPVCFIQLCGSRLIEGFRCFFLCFKRVFSMLFIIFFFHSRAKRKRERGGRKREREKESYAVTRSFPACKNIQYPLVRQLVKYCARAVFRYAFRETNLPQTCYGGFHGIFDR